MKQFIILALTVCLTTGEHRYNLVYNYHGPPAPLSSDGKVIDTPEVAHARVAHLATYAATAARVTNNTHKHKWSDILDQLPIDENDDVKSTSKYNDLINRNGPGPIYHGPLAPLNEDGQVIDTPEVASAKAAHLAAHAAQIHISDDNNWNYGDHQHRRYPVPNIKYASYYFPTNYRGPPAPLAPDGRVIETPEVAQARVNHLRAHAHAAAINSAAEAASTHQDHYEKCYH